MTEKKRNIAVGITVLVALCGLGYMVILFGQMPVFAHTGYLLRITYPQTGGVALGNDVRLNGLRIGTVTDIRFLDDPRKGVAVECRINRDTRIPRNVEASIGTQGIGGGGFVTLTTTSDQGPVAWLPRDGSANLSGKLPMGGFLGAELSSKLEKVADGLDTLTGNLNRTLFPGEAAATMPSTASAPSTGLGGTLARLDRVLEGLADITSEPANRQNIKESLANLRAATESGAKAMEDLRQFAGEARASLKNVDEGVGEIRQLAIDTRNNVDSLAAKLIEDADKLGRLFAQLDEAAAKLNSGEGSAGKFLNDPQLYNQILESTRQLTRTLTDLQTTLTVWRTEGVKMRLK
jgi:phospholipid/cholesterol/gamma-HCH transport system substrate-binding protein